MTRKLTLQRPIPGDPPPLHARFSTDPSTWLPPPARWRGRSTWTVTLEAGPVGRTVDCRVGPVWTIGTERWRSLGWLPVPERTDALPVDRGLPTLRGELGVGAQNGGSVLILHATYQPPAGVLGSVADSAGLHAVAQRTAARFLEAVAARLTEQA